MQPYQPVSGQLTLSPTHRNKKLKLQIPSARTTNQCDSRKISYLGQTQNTISYRNQANRKKTIKSALPTDQISKIFNHSVELFKNKGQFRSQAVSPSGRKTSTNKKLKNLSANYIVKGKELVHDLLADSQDNIIGYTNQSSQLERISRQKNSQLGLYNKQPEKDMAMAPKFKLRSETPILEEERGIISGIRQFEKSAQLKKQYLNYEYLKQKVLVLASVKKIQRAWRHYKTKKLLKSYSNNISLKFTGKLKNQLLANKDCQQNKILTVRSCGLSGRSNQFKQKTKKNLLYPNDDSPIKQQSNFQEQQSEKKKKDTNQIYSAREKKHIREFSTKSAVVQFQKQQIRRWEELINNIKQGKKVDEVLEKSFRRKQELEKQLNDNLKDIGVQKSDPLKKLDGDPQIQKAAIELPREPQQSQLKKPPILQPHQPHQPHQLLPKPSPPITPQQQPSIPSGPSLSSQISITSQQQQPNKQIQNYPSTLTMQHRQMPIHAQKSCFQQSEEGTTTQRRRQKLEYFQNQLRKIDNQYSESNLSKSHHSEIDDISLSSNNIQIKNICLIRDNQEEENLKLKRKIEAMARIKMLDQEEEEVSDDDGKFQENSIYLYGSLQRNPEKPVSKIQQQPRTKSVKSPKQIDCFPLTVSKPSKNTMQAPTKDYEADRLQTFRKKPQSSQVYQKSIFQDLQNLRLQHLKRKKIPWSQKETLAQKIQQQIFYDLLLEFSQNQQFISKVQELYIKNNNNNNNNNSKNKTNESTNNKNNQQIEKPEGICTNLESIKDYLENFVAFAFEQEPIKLFQGFNQPRGPTTASLLRIMNNDTLSLPSQNRVLSDQLFDQHWSYASGQIYFDAKYPDDPVKEQQRVKYLKLITKMYFKAIFDGFNQCLDPFRVQGLQGKLYPWQTRPRTKHGIVSIQQIKPLIRQGYKKLSQMAIIYCGLLFQDKRHSMSQKMIQDIQKQRLDTLVQIELDDTEYKWNSTKIQKAWVLYKMGKIIYNALVLEVCEEIVGFGMRGGYGTD